MSRVKSECTPIRRSKATTAGGAEGEYKATGGRAGAEETNIKGKSRKKCVQVSSTNKHRQLLGIILLNQWKYREKLAVVVIHL